MTLFGRAQAALPVETLQPMEGEGQPLQMRPLQRFTAIVFDFLTALEPLMHTQHILENEAPQVPQIVARLRGKLQETFPDIAPQLISRLRILQSAAADIDRLDSGFPAAIRLQRLEAQSTSISSQLMNRRGLANLRELSELETFSDLVLAERLNSTLDMIDKKHTLVRESRSCGTAMEKEAAGQLRRFSDDPDFRANGEIQIREISIGACSITAIVDQSSFKAAGLSHILAVHITNTPYIFVHEGRCNDNALRHEAFHNVWDGYFSNRALTPLELLNTGFDRASKQTEDVKRLLAEPDLYIDLLHEEALADYCVLCDELTKFGQRPDLKSCLTTIHSQIREWEKGLLDRARNPNENKNADYHRLCSAGSKAFKDLLAAFEEITFIAHYVENNFPSLHAIRTTFAYLLLLKPSQFNLIPNYLKAEFGEVIVGQAQVAYKLGLF